MDISSEPSSILPSQVSTSIILKTEEECEQIKKEESEGQMTGTQTTEPASTVTQPLNLMVINAPTKDSAQTPNGTPLLLEVNFFDYLGYQLQSSLSRQPSVAEKVVPLKSLYHAYQNKKDQAIQMVQHVFPVTNGFSRFVSFSCNHRVTDHSLTKKLDEKKEQDADIQWIETVTSSQNPVDEVSVSRPPFPMPGFNMPMDYRGYGFPMTGTQMIGPVSKVTHPNMIYWHIPPQPFPIGQLPTEAQFCPLCQEGQMSLAEHLLHMNQGMCVPFNTASQAPDLINYCQNSHIQRTEPVSAVTNSQNPVGCPLTLKDAVPVSPMPVSNVPKEDRGQTATLPQEPIEHISLPISSQYSDVSQNPSSKPSISPPSQDSTACNLKDCEPERLKEKRRRYCPKTRDQLSAFIGRGRTYYWMRRASETLEEAAQRRAREKDYNFRKKQAETHKERETRLSKARDYNKRRELRSFEFAENTTGPPSTKTLACYRVVRNDGKQQKLEENLLANLYSDENQNMILSTALIDDVAKKMLNWPTNLHL